MVQLIFTSLECLILFITGHVLRPISLHKDKESFRKDSVSYVKVKWIFQPRKKKIYTNIKIQISKQDNSIARLQYSFGN